VFQIWFSSFFLFPFANIKWNMLIQGFWKFYGSPENHFSTKRGGACRPVASSISNPTSQMFWKGLDSNCYLHPYLDKFTPHFCFFGYFFSEISRKFTDSVVMSVKPSEAIKNGPRMKLECNNLFTHTHFAKYTPVFVFLTGFFPKHLRTLRIPQWWVLNILRWSNKGHMPTKNGPRTKLGYDSCPSLLIFYWR